MKEIPLANVLASGNIANNQIKKLIDPTDAQDAATKAYVDLLEARIAALEPKPLSIGDIRAGGIVFWIDPKDNTQGLVCAFSDYESKVQWDSGLEPMPDLPNVPDVTSEDGNPTGLGAEIGDGINNTKNILNDQPKAQSAVASKQVGDEWFLPSIRELELLYLNKDIIERVSGVAPLDKESYWSSTQFGRTYAWFLDMTDSELRLSYEFKAALFGIRAIRAFNKHLL